MAITWKNVAGPSFTGVQQGLASASNIFDKAVAGLENVVDDQREMNIFGQGKERATNIQAGKEAILGSTGSLDDWKSADLGTLLAGYDDTKTRAELTDYFNQRDDTLRTETKADLDISKAEQSILHAAAGEKRAWAQNARAEVTSKLSIQSAGREQQRHNNYLFDVTQSRNNEAALGALSSSLYKEAQEGGDTESMQAALEARVNAVNPITGKPIFSGNARANALAQGKQLINGYNTLTAGEQTEFNQLSAKQDAKYNGQGLQIGEKGMAELSLETKANDLIIARADDLNTKVSESVKSYGNMGGYINKVAKGNTKEVQASVKEAITNATPAVITGVRNALKAQGYPENMIEKYISTYQIPEEVSLHVLQGQAITQDTEFFGDAEGDILGDWYGGNDLTPFKLDLVKFATTQFVDKIASDAAKVSNITINRQVSKINRHKSTELEKERRKLLGQKPRETESINAIKG